MLVRVITALLSLLQSNVPGFQSSCGGRLSPGVDCLKRLHLSFFNKRSLNLQTCGGARKVLSVSPEGQGDI